MRLGMRRQATVSLLLILAVGNGVFITAAFTHITDYVGEPAFEINRFTIDGGGDMLSAGGGFELSGTIGQPDAGLVSGGGFTLAGGFWFPLADGDCDTDGSVDLIDFDDFQPCLSGPSGGVGRGCGCFDVDQDGDVDLSDVAAFQHAFTGG